MGPSSGSKESGLPITGKRGPSPSSPSARAPPATARAAMKTICILQFAFCNLQFLIVSPVQPVLIVAACTLLLLVRALLTEHARRRSFQMLLGIFRGHWGQVFLIGNWR